MKNKECKHFKDCGGCHFRLAFPKGQINKKEEYLNRLFEGREVAPLIAMDNPYNYRNKVLRTYRSVGKNKIISGIYEKGSHWVVPIDSCLIEDALAQEVQRTVFSLVKKYRLSIFDEDKGQGLLRHVLVRTSSQDQASVTFIINGRSLPSQDKFLRELIHRQPQVGAVYLNPHGRKTSVVIEGDLIQVYGKGPIRDKLLGLDILLSGDSFYQINHNQAEKLYSKVMELLDIKKGETVLDAYCGIGIMALLAAKEGASALGVENNLSALADALEMKKINGISSVNFIGEDATKYLKETEKSKKKIDKIILDPPRTGTTEDFIEACLKIAPESIVYVSCNPQRLKEELPLFEKSYKVETIYPVDLFPFTRHVESVVLLTKVHK
ncbi:MAG: 23S rRNA (uracil(1939)-C(5))-methyltransferase RlmD [Tissierellia bacterium]|nr:23S rRNA (uracil(1939)-C(5))-methyltransferase RlmD [Tissierellia bacterium]